MSELISCARDSIFQFPTQLLFLSDCRSENYRQWQDGCSTFLVVHGDPHAPFLELLPPRGRHALWFRHGQFRWYPRKSRESAKPLFDNPHLTSNRCCNLLTWDIFRRGSSGNLARTMQRLRRTLLTLCTLRSSPLLPLSESSSGVSLPARPLRDSVTAFSSSSPQSSPRSVSSVGSFMVVAILGRLIGLTSSIF